MAHDDGQDGKVMRHALGSCATLTDFELYIDSLKNAGVLNCNSNFGVIDAQKEAVLIMRWATGDL